MAEWLTRQPAKLFPSGACVRITPVSISFFVFFCPLFFFVLTHLGFFGPSLAMDFVAYPLRQRQITSKHAALVPPPLPVPHLDIRRPASLVGVQDGGPRKLGRPIFFPSGYTAEEESTLCNMRKQKGKIERIYEKTTRRRPHFKACNAFGHIRLSGLYRPAQNQGNFVEFHRLNALHRKHCEGPRH